MRRLLPLRQSEAALQMASWRYLQLALPAEVRAWHVPNGGLRKKGEAGKLKAMGVLPGVPDFNLILPNAQAAFIELKVGKNDLTPDQIEFRNWAIARGCGYAVCRSVEEVEAVITRWLSAFQMKPRGTLLQLRGALL